MPEDILYLPVEFDVGADFIWMSIMLSNGILIGRLPKIAHSDPQSHELTISKIKEAQEMYSPESRHFPESIEIYYVSSLYFLRDKGFDCAVINPIITKNSTNMNVRKLHDDKFDSKKAAKVGLDASLKASIIPDDVIIDLYNLVRDHYYFKDLQSAIVLKLHTEFKVSFPAYLNVFSKVTTQTSLKFLEACSLATGMFAAPKDKLVEIIRSTARFGEAYALTRYDVICTTAKDTAVFGRILPNNALRTRLYIKICGGYQAYLDSMLEELHRAVGKLEETPNYDRISFIQILHGVGFLSAVALIAEMGSFDLLSSPKKLYARFGLDPGVNGPGRFRGDRVHISRRSPSLARRILHIAAINSLKVDKATKAPVNPVIYDYYTRKCVSKKKALLSGPSFTKSATSFSLCSEIISSLSSLCRKNTVNIMQRSTRSLWTPLPDGDLN